jgi:hypothetical protein
MWNELYLYLAEEQSSAGDDVLRTEGELWCHSGFTVVSQWCKSGVTGVLQWCHSGVTVVSQWCYSSVTWKVMMASSPVRKRSLLYGGDGDDSGDGYHDDGDGDDSDDGDDNTDDDTDGDGAENEFTHLRVLGLILPHFGLCTHGDNAGL